MSVSSVTSSAPSFLMGMFRSYTAGMLRVVARTSFLLSTADPLPLNSSTFPCRGVMHEVHLVNMSQKVMFCSADATANEKHTPRGVSLPSLAASTPEGAPEQVPTQIPYQS